MCIQNYLQCMCFTANISSLVAELYFSVPNTCNMMSRLVTFCEYMYKVHTKVRLEWLLHYCNEFSTKLRFFLKELAMFKIPSWYLRGLGLEYIILLYVVQPNFFENSNNNMQAIGSISLIAVDWFKFGLLDGLESYSPGMLAHSTLGLQASIFVLHCALKSCIFLLPETNVWSFQ